MADEIKLKAPTVEQQVVVNIQGEEKLRSFADTLDKMSKGRNLQKYWKEQEVLIKDVVEAYKKFGRVANEDTASELLKTANALKAMSNSDISSLSPELNNISSALQKAEGVAGHLVDAFSINAFKDAFSAFETLRAYGVDIQKLFTHFEINTNVDKLVSDLENANRTINELTLRTRELQDKLDDSESGNGIRAVREECENLRWEIENIRNEAANTFSAFLTSNNINADSYQYEEFFERIREGSLTAQEAIAEFKRDYSYLLDNGASFDVSQLQDFSRRLDDVSVKITEISNKLDDISSNGVKVSEGNTSGNLEELSNVINEIENANVCANTSNIYEALSKILITIREIGQADTDNIYHLYATIRNLAQLNDLKINKASLDNLADCLERICKIDNTSSLSNLSLVDFKKFNDLHISKASLNNLAEYLPQIANIDTEKLIELTKIDFSNLNEFKIDKVALDNLKQFADSLREVFQGNDVESVKGASIAKNDFASANERVQSSVDESSVKLASEAELFERIAKNARDAAEAKNEFVNANKNVSDSTADKSNISSENPTVETSQNDEITASIRKKKEELASYELQLEETRYEVEKLSKSENEAYGFSRVASGKQLERQYDNITKRIFGKYDPSTGKDGSKKWLALDNLANIDESTLKSYQMWQEELQKVGYTLSEIRQTSVGLEADILPIDGKAITNAEEFRKALDSITTAPSENIGLLNKQIIELEAKISSLKSEISSLESSKNSPIKDVFQGDAKVNTDASTTAIKEESQALEQVSASAKDAATSKEKFANANKEVKASADSSTHAINKESDALKSEWDKNVKAIQDYMDAVTKLNNLNAKDKGTGKYASQIALQEKNVEELKEKALEARTAITSMINPHDVPLNTWRDYLDVMEKFSQASLGSAESVAKLEDALRKMDFSSLESAGTKFESQFKNLSIKPDGDHQFLSWTNDLNELNAKIDEYNSKVKYLKENNIVDGKQVDEVKKLRDEIEKIINAMTKTPQTKRGWTDIGASKAAEKVANVLKQNTKMSKEAKDAIRAYYNELRSGNPSQPIDEILVKVNQLVQKERELGRVGKSFGEIFKEKVIYGGAAQLAGMVGFYDLINVGREGFQTIRELDTALVDLKKTTAMNSSQLEEFYFDSNDVAKQMGVTTQAIIEQASAWSRLGYNTKEQATQMAELSSQFAAISPDMDLDTATDGLVSSMKAFDIEVSNVERDIMDNINRIGNTAATSNGEIVDMLTRSSAAMAAANNTIQETIALETAAVEITRNAETTGTAFKTLSMRIRGRQSLPPYTVMYMLCA